MERNSLQVSGEVFCEGGSCGCRVFLVKVFYQLVSVDMG